MKKALFLSVALVAVNFVLSGCAVRWPHRAKVVQRIPCAETQQEEVAPVIPWARLEPRLGEIRNLNEYYAVEVEVVGGDFGRSRKFNLTHLFGCCPFKRLHLEYGVYRVRVRKLYPGTQTSIGKPREIFLKIRPGLRPRDPPFGWVLHIR